MHETLVLANIIGGWGIVELAVVLMIGLLIFGKRLPEVGRGLGRSISEFKRGMSEAGNAVTELPDQNSSAVRPAANQLPAATPAASPQETEQRIAKLTAELQALQQEVAKQKNTPSS
jgi:sec-independent protein translocase protein TatA